MSDQPKSIGLLIGREWSWPSAFMTEVNKRDKGVTADFVKLGGTFLEHPDDEIIYDVIIDRMSHEIPYYRTYLKYAALHGSYIINNPFTCSADDKFFGISLVNHLGIQTPKTATLPNKRVETENVPESFRNLKYPMNWQGIIDYVGVPAILKDVHTGGRRIAHRVHNVDELIQWYDESDMMTLILQEIIESDTHIHCFVIGQEKVLLTRYSLEDKRYLENQDELKENIKEEAITSALKVTQAYGYDINMVEFVLQDEQLLLINPTNPAPDLDINLLGADAFGWCVNAIADFAISMTQKEHQQFRNQPWYQAIS